MEGQKQLLSEETAQTSECKGIEAPDLIQQDITADEEGTTQQDLKLNEAQVVSNSEEVISTEQSQCEETQAGEIEVKVELQENKQEEEKTSSDGDDKTTDDNEVSENTLPDKNSSVEGEDSTNVQSTLELNKDSSNKVESENTQNTTEGKAKENTTEKVNAKADDKENEKKGSNGSHYVEVILDDGNNNAENSEGAKKKDSVRRTRFSSEITIQPKAYFQAGAETVVMMPPSSTSDDVFNNDSCHSPSTKSSSQHLAKPSDSVLPRTFLPLTVFTCLFCPIIGIFAVYKSYSVKQFIKNGDLRKANEASQHARQLAVLSLCIGFFFVLAIITIAVLVSTLT